MKQKQNQKDKIQTKMKYMYSALQFQKQLKKKKETIQCYHCSSWQQKTQELVWQYEQLLMIKEKQIQTLTKMVQKLDDELKKTQGKVDVLSKKTKHYELSIERQRPSLIETQNIITYYKERQVELLNQLKMAEGELFTKNIFYKDQIQMKQDKVLRQIGNLQANRSAKEIIHLKPNHVIQQEYNQSMLSNSSSMAKVLHQNFCDLQKMNQEKMILELKNRIANLKAIQLTVLK